jgi:hypothetical protein
MKRYAVFSFMSHKHEHYRSLLNLDLSSQTSRTQAPHQTL